MMQFFPLELHSCWGAATHNCSTSVGWHCYSFQGIFGGDGHPHTRDILRAALVVDPDVAILLTVVALCEAGLGFYFFDFITT
jgi:hypothetical protein